MTVADRIKNTETWEPEIKPQPASSRHERTGQWVADVAVSADAVEAFEGLTSQSGSSRYGDPSTSGPIDHAHVPLGKTSASSISALVHRPAVFPTESPKQAAPDTSATLIDLSGDHAQFDKASTPADASYEDRPNTNRDSGVDPQALTSAIVKPSAPPEASAPVLQPKQTVAHTASLSPSVAPYSQIHRLAEPVSSRKLPSKESIILLKASMVNGFKFPPWDKTPSTEEFALQRGVDLFK
jgi:calpain-7